MITSPHNIYVDEKNKFEKMNSHSIQTDVRDLIPLRSIIMSAI